MTGKTARYLIPIALILFLSSCATQPARMRAFEAPRPVGPPGPGYAVVVDNLLVIADVSRSMRQGGKIDTEKAILTAFNAGIPPELDSAGLRTFGKSAYHYSVLAHPLQSYNRAELAGVINSLQAGCGSSPLGWALRKAQNDLKDSQGNIAILVVSDGENLVRDTIGPALALKEIYGDRVCIHTIHVGQSEKGRRLLEQVARHSGCGIATSADELATEAAMRSFILEVFYRQKIADSDGDGVPDHLDECPDTPAGAVVDERGCPPDSDGDGVPDNLDKCPDTPAGVTVDSDGCPLDSDGDGVPDYIDQCPDTPRGATVDEVGCWSIQGITFEYNRWNISPQFQGLLDQNMAVLRMNPQMRIEIQGHTDSTGSDQYNQQLSERRAEAVKQYFVSGGIDPSRIATRGFGESQPIATNETPEGRARNRRIEIEILSR